MTAFSDSLRYSAFCAGIQSLNCPASLWGMRPGPLKRNALGEMVRLPHKAGTCHGVRRTMRAGAARSGPRRFFAHQSVHIPSIRRPQKALAGCAVDVIGVKQLVRHGKAPRQSRPSSDVHLISY
jgi:hypothetical protein